MTIEEIEKDLLSNGYVCGTPSLLAAEEDGGICQRSLCSKCHHEGMLFRPFLKRGFSYKCFAVCPECKNVEEF